MVCALFRAFCVCLFFPTYLVWSSLVASMLLQMALFCPFLWMSCIPLRIIHSSVNGHLGCCHVLAFVNRAAMNMQVHVSLLSRVLSGYMPKSGIAGSYGSSMYRLLSTSILFSIVAVPVYIPTNSAGGFPFLHSPSSTCYLWIYSWWPFWLVWGGISW